MTLFSNKDISGPLTYVGGPLISIKNYPLFLESCWQEHLNEKPEDAPTVISTFAGCGGSSLGYSMAGFHELLAVELVQNAVDTFKMNFSGIPVYHGDIAKLSVDQCLDLAGIGPGQLDVFDGSPPCQGFSIAGKRRVDDQRNLLFHEYARLLLGLKPKVFVMENVPGMIKGNMKSIFLNCFNKLESSGYKIVVKLLNTMYFGVPQNRERLIFIGIRNDLGSIPTYPAAWSNPINVKDALQEVQDDKEKRFLPDLLLNYSKIHPGGWCTNNILYYNIKKSFAGARSTKWLEWNNICGTLIKSEIATTGIVHPDHKRYISLSEAKRIGSFPYSFNFSDRKNGLERIGNSVPPLLMRSIALHIKKEILERI